MPLFCILPAHSRVDSRPLQSSLHDTCNALNAACTEAAGKMVKIQTTTKNPLTIPNLYMILESIMHTYSLVFY